MIGYRLVAVNKARRLIVTGSMINECLIIDAPNVAAIEWLGVLAHKAQRAGASYEQAKGMILDYIELTGPQGRTVHEIKA